MSCCSSTWSNDSSVVIENVVEPVPENAARSELPPEPIDVCTVSTPGRSTSCASTSCAASSRTSRLVPSGRVCRTVSVFCPLSPRKFVFSRTG